MIVVEAAAVSKDELFEEAYDLVDSFDRSRANQNDFLPLTEYEKVLLLSFLFDLIEHSKGR